MTKLPLTNLPQAFNSFENQDAALRLIEIGINTTQEQVQTYEKAWAAAERNTVQGKTAGGQTYERAWTAAIEERPFAWQYAEVDSILRQRAAVGNSGTTGGSRMINAQRWTYADHFTGLADGPRSRKSLAINPRISTPAELDDGLHYLAAYRAAVRSDLPEVRDAALEKLTAKDMKMPDVHKRLQRRNFRPGAEIAPVSAGSNQEGAIIQYSVMFRFLEELYSSNMFPRIDDTYSRMELSQLRRPVLLHRALDILKMEDNDELLILRQRRPEFHDELWEALEAVKEEYEEVAENEAGNLVLRVKEGEVLKAKL